jgi:hypothetical protein
VTLLYVTELSLILLRQHRVVQDEVTDEQLHHFMLKGVLQGLCTDLLKVMCLIKFQLDQMLDKFDQCRLPPNLPS